MSMYLIDLIIKTRITSYKLGQHVQCTMYIHIYIYVHLKTTTKI